MLLFANISALLPDIPEAQRPLASSSLLPSPISISLISFISHPILLHPLSTHSCHHPASLKGNGRNCLVKSHHVSSILGSFSVAVSWRMAFAALRQAPSSGLGLLLHPHPRMPSRASPTTPSMTSRFALAIHCRSSSAVNALAHVLSPGTRGGGAFWVGDTHLTHLFRRRKQHQRLQCQCHSRPGCRCRDNNLHATVTDLARYPLSPP